MNPHTVNFNFNHPREARGEGEKQTELVSTLARLLFGASGYKGQNPQTPARPRLTVSSEPETPALFIPLEGLDPYLQNKERKVIEAALTLTEGNKTQAAKLLRVSYRSLRHRLEKLRINRP
ncbi:hypothetical protein MYX75_02540 [Acidobacteria bacterium AH-259-A15]|nr:hypothetical protein [Acidobacteria bacterium AH-259-A15]